jgi:biuret amidohydrolase
MQEFAGVTLPASLEEIISPQNSALIVYDTQAAITVQIPNGREICPAGEPTAGCRPGFGRAHIFHPSYVTAQEFDGSVSRPEGDGVAAGGLDGESETHVSADSPAFQIVPEIAPLLNEGIVDKITMSAFEGTYLEIALRDCGIRSFLIAGVALEIGIDPTRRQGADLGFGPILVHDACGFGNQEAANHSLASLRHMGDTIVTDVDSVSNLLSKAAQAS